jgi:hypothetical protein
MKTIEAKSTVGNFLVNCKAEVTEEQFAYFASKGLLWTMQRQTEVDKVLGAFTTGADGKSKRKDKWTRNSVDYSADMGRKLHTVFASLAMPDEMPDTVTTADVIEYIRDVAESKFTEERALMTRHESANDLEEWLESKVKFLGDTHGDDGEFNIDALKAVREFKKAALAGL